MEIHSRTWVAGTEVPTDGCWIGIRRHPMMWGRRPKWEASRLAASGGVASSGHPVDGSAQGGRRRRWPVQFRFVHGVRRPITPGPVFGHVAERARLALKKHKKNISRKLGGNLSKHAGIQMFSSIPLWSRCDLFSDF